MLLLFWRPTHHYLGGRPDRVEKLDGLEPQESLQKRSFTAVIGDRVDLLAVDYDLDVYRPPRPPAPVEPPPWIFPPRPVPGTEWVTERAGMVPETTLLLGPVPLTQTEPVPVRMMEEPRTLRALPVEESRRINRRQKEDG